MPSYFLEEQSSINTERRRLEVGRGKKQLFLQVAVNRIYCTVDWASWAANDGADDANWLHQPALICLSKAPIMLHLITKET